MKRSNLSIWLYLLLVFCSGAAVGAFGLKLYTATEVSAAKGLQNADRIRPDDWRKRYIQDLKTRLELDQKQETRLQVILDETKASFDAFHARSRPEAERIKANQRSQVRAMLNSKQSLEFDKMQAEREQREKDRRRER